MLDVVYIGSPNSLDALKLVLPEADVFLPNDDEAALLLGTHDPIEQAETFRDLGAETVVITQGEKGSVLIGPNVRLRAGVYPTTFVGGTGAGDAFDAGYIAGLLCGRRPGRLPPLGRGPGRQLRPLDRRHRKRLQPRRGRGLHARARVADRGDLSERLRENHASAPPCERLSP